MTVVTGSPRLFTGWHMLAIMVAFFGVVISVNMLMAYYASSSWSGILAKNTYVASQDFNLKAAEARVWTARGFKGRLVVADGVVRYRLEGPQEEIGLLSRVTVVFHRPVGEAQDFSMILLAVGQGLFEARRHLAPGPWIVDVAAVADGRTIFHQAERIAVPAQ